MPSRKPVAIGDRFGRLVVLRELESSKTPNGTVNRRVECRCDCGVVKAYRLPRLRNGRTKSCGCLAREMAVERGHRYGGRPTHGGAGTLEYTTWNGMKARCYNPAASGYRRYGGRGITVCDRWLKSFPAFLEDMGRRPSPEHSIGRIDNDGPYSPGNCRWETDEEQARNRGNNVTLTHCGETLCVSEWAERLGVNDALIRHRLDRGWTAKDALTLPVAEKHQSDAFYRTPISKRDAAWYREYARREAFCLAR